MGGVFSKTRLITGNDLVGSLIGYVTSAFVVEPDAGLTDDLLEVLFENDGSNYETEKLCGTVTKLREHQSLAIINDEIYMDLSFPTPGGRKLRLGDSVSVIVKRRSLEDAWVVDRVEMIDRSSTWKTQEEKEASSLEVAACCDGGPSNGDHLKGKTIVGQITSITAEKVAVINDNELKFELSLDDAYVVGDFLAVEVLFDPEEPEEKPKCIKWQPLRKWKFEGRINVVEGDTGVIDNDVYFQSAACMNG